MSEGASQRSLQSLTQRIRAEALSVGDIDDLTVVPDPAHHAFTCEVQLKSGAQRTKFVAHFGGVASGKRVYFRIEDPRR